MCDTRHVYEYLLCQWLLSRLVELSIHGGDACGGCRYEGLSINWALEKPNTIPTVCQQSDISAQGHKAIEHPADFSFTHLLRTAFMMKIDITLYPMNISFFRSVTIMPGA